MLSPEILPQIRQALAAVHGPRLRGVVLFGSEARGQAEVGSDVDLLVLLDEPVRYLDDLERNTTAVYPFELRLGRAISAKPVSPTQFAQKQSPFMENARREGIAIGHARASSCGLKVGMPL